MPKSETSAAESPKLHALTTIINAVAALDKPHDRSDVLSAAAKYFGLKLQMEGNGDAR